MVGISPNGSILRKRENKLMKVVRKHKQKQRHGWNI